MGNGCGSAKSGGALPPELPSLKIALVGDPGVGKSSVLLRYTRNQFSPLYIPTKKVGIENIVRKLNVPANTVVSMTFWDIPGREDMDMHKSYFRNLDAAIVVVDMTNGVTIDMANVWKQTVLNKLTKLVKEENNNNNAISEAKEVPINPVGFPVLLLGNKFDIIEEEIYNELASRQVSASMEVPMDMNFEHPSVTHLNNTAEQHGFMGSVMVSARQNDDSVTMAIQSMVRNILEKRDIPRKWKPVEEKPKVVKEKPFLYQMLDRSGEPKVAKNYHYNKLETIGKQETDAIIEKADLLVKEISLLRHYYAVALARFKTVCVKGKLVEDEGASFEDCIVALKSGVKKGTSLQVCEDESFYKLEVELEEGQDKVKQTKPWKYAYKCFHNEYAAICKTILDKGPDVNKALEMYDAALEKSVDNFEQNPPVDPRLQKENGEQTNIIICNRAKILHSRNEMKETIKTVDGAKKKIADVDHW